MFAVITDQKPARQAVAWHNETQVEYWVNLYGSVRPPSGPEKPDPVVKPPRSASDSKAKTKAKRSSNIKHTVAIVRAGGLENGSGVLQRSISKLPNMAVGWLHESNILGNLQKSFQQAED